MTSSKTNNSKAPYYISLLLVMALGVSLAKLMWLILTPTPSLNMATERPASSQNLSANSKTATHQNFGKIIANLHLFGETKKPAVAVKQADQTIPKAPPPVKLDLKLHGIVAYTNKQGFALISSSGQAQKVYGVGDKINDDPDVTISKILPNKVIINNHGAASELLLPRKDASKNNNQADSFRNQPPLSRPAPIRNNQRFRNSSSTGNAPDLSKFRQQVIANPSKLMDVAKPTPAYDAEDEFIGFRVQPGSNRQIFRQIGLRSNDIITSVNGIELDSPNKSAMVLGELSQASSVTITVKRGQQTLTLSHSF